MTIRRFGAFCPGHSAPLPLFAPFRPAPASELLSPQTHHNGPKDDTVHCHGCSGTARRMSPRRWGLSVRDDRAGPRRGARTIRPRVGVHLLDRVPSRGRAKGRVSERKQPVPGPACLHPARRERRPFCRTVVKTPTSPSVLHPTSDFAHLAAPAKPPGQAPQPTPKIDPKTGPRPGEVSGITRGTLETTGVPFSAYRPVRAILARCRSRPVSLRPTTPTRSSSLT